MGEAAGAGPRSPGRCPYGGKDDTPTLSPSVDADDERAPARDRRAQERSKNDQEVIPPSEEASFVRWNEDDLFVQILERTFSQQKHGLRQPPMTSSTPHRAKTTTSL